MSAPRQEFDARGAAPCWTRPDGSPVPLELLNFPELVAAHQILVTGEWSGEDTRLLLAAIEAELEARWRRKTRDPLASQSDEEDRSRAA
jgi:hypothetical protein